MEVALTRIIVALALFVVTVVAIRQALQMELDAVTPIVFAAVSHG